MGGVASSGSNHIVWTKVLLCSPFVSLSSNNPDGAPG